MTPALLDIPDDGLEHVAGFLDAPSLLQFITSHPRMVQLSKTTSFWCTLINSHIDADSHHQKTLSESFDSPQAARKVYLTKAYVHALPLVEWKPRHSSRLSPTGREGHSACTLGDNILITGGFTDDEHIYLLNTTNDEDWRKIVPNEVQPWRHPQLPPLQEHNPPAAANPFARHPNGLDNVYGASLTALDEKRAIRFGGFRGGGYSGECDQLALLTLTDEDTFTWQVIQPLNRVAPRAYHTATLILGRYLYIFGGMASDHGCMRSEAILDTHTWTWLTDVSVTSDLERQKPTERHGHSMIMDEKRNRMVLFGGGTGTDLLRSGIDNAEVWELSMGTRWKTATKPKEFQESFPWEWRLIMANDDSDDEPEYEQMESDDEGSELNEDDVHHQNMVAHIDNLGRLGRERQESNNSRQADDTDEFHPLPNGNNSDEEGDSDSSYAPHEDRRRNTLGNSNGEEILNAGERADRANNAQGDNSQTNATVKQRIILTDAEKLILGRCHLGFKVGPDTVILAFGSGRPSTNGVIKFDLSNDSFFRVRYRTNTFPVPRFTAAGALFGCHNSYLLVHGGYTSQQGFAISDMCVLDLAPALERELVCLPSQPNYESSRPVTDDDIGRRLPFGHHFGHGMGIGGMEDLLQNMFFELAANAGGRRPRGEPVPGGGAARVVDLADMLNVLVAGGRRPHHNDEGDEEEDFDQDEEDFIRLHWGRAAVEEVDEDFDYDDMSEVS